MHAHNLSMDALAPAHRAPAVQTVFDALGGLLSACTQFSKMGNKAWQLWGIGPPCAADFPPEASHYIREPGAAQRFTDRAMRRSARISYRFDGPPTRWAPVIPDIILSYQYLIDRLTATVNAVKAARRELCLVPAGDGHSLDVSLLLALRGVHAVVHPARWGHDGLALLAIERRKLPEEWQASVRRLVEHHRLLFDLEADAPLPQLDGWSQKALLTTASIGRTLFIEIATEAKVRRPGAGQHGHTFGVKSLTLLIKACASAPATKTKWRKAGLAWQALLDVAIRKSGA